MKRWLVCLCCAALLGTALPWLGAAEESESTTEPVTTSSTTADTPEPEPEPEPEPTATKPPVTFQFSEYNRSYDESTGTLSVVWDYAGGGGAEVIGVIVDGSHYGVSGSGSRFSAKLGSLSGGTHSLQYVFRLSDGSTKTQEADPLVIGSTRALNLALSAQGSRAVAVLTDQTGEAVADYPLQFTLNRSTTVNRTTDANGRVDLTVSGTLTTVTCVAPGRTVGTITYIGTSETWQAATADPSATQAQDDDDDDDEGEESTTSRTRWSATQPSVTTGPNKTYTTIQGAGTTAKEGNSVAVNASFDEGVVDAFGLKQDDFNKKARLLMDAELYGNLVGNTKSSVMLTLGYNGFAITDQHISKLVSGKSKYSRYDDIKRVALTLGLQFVDENKKVVPIQVAPEGSYTVRLPVPDTMLDCPVLAVAMIEKDGLSHLIDVQVKNGYLEFVTNGFTSIAVLGFGDHAVRTGGGVAWQLIVLLVVGVLMLAGAALLTFLFVLRKPKKVTEGPADEMDIEQDEKQKPSEEETFSASEFMIDQILTEHAAAPEELSGEDEPAEESRDLYSSDSRRPPNP